MVSDNIFVFLPFILLLIIPFLIVGLSKKRPFMALVIAGVISVTLMGIPAILYFSSERIGCAFIVSEDQRCANSAIHDGLAGVAPETGVILLLLVVLYFVKRRRAQALTTEFMKEFE